MDFQLVKRVLAALEARGVNYALFGATALNLHGLVRATEDLDVFVEPTPENIERLRAALNDVFDDPHLADLRTDDLLGEYPSVRYVPPSADMYFDILTRLGEAYTFADLETMRVPLEDLTVSVVTPKMLYRMKRDTVRPKDRIDAEALRRAFRLEDE
jgi:hypothetical protein